MVSMRRHYVPLTSLRRHVPAGNLAPPPNILNLGPPQYSKPSYAYGLNIRDKDIWVFQNVGFHQYSFNALSKCLSEYIVVPVLCHIPVSTMSVLKRGKQTLLECNNGILNITSASKLTAANSFKQYFAAHSGLH